MVSEKTLFFAARFKRIIKGFLAERLGTALQKLLQRFESAGNLTKIAAATTFGLLRRFCFGLPGPCFRGEIRFWLFWQHEQVLKFLDAGLFFCLGQIQ